MQGVRNETKRRSDCRDTGEEKRMTSDQREREIAGMLKALSQLKPRDCDELTLWSDDTGRGTCEPCPTFPCVTLTLSPYDIVRIADKQEER